VGGIRAGGKHAKLADYLLRNQLTSAAVIVEIKTPCSPLLASREYRQDVFAPSTDLSGAIQQILEQRRQFMREIDKLRSELEEDVPRLEPVEPQCVVVIGNGQSEPETRGCRRSFEMYRSELRNVRVVTFDELRLLRRICGWNWRSPALPCTGSSSLFRGLMERKPVATGLGSRGFRGRIVRTNRSRPKSEGAVQIGLGGSRPEVELVPLRAALEAWIGVPRKMNGEDAALPASSRRGSDAGRVLGRPTKRSPRTR
jgi:hypothetical protein